MPRELQWQERREAIKRGRKFEKKKNYVRALQCFEQAAALQGEEPVALFRGQNVMIRI